MTDSQPVEVDDLTDGREPGHWQSRYNIRAWTQICAELLYLIVLLLVCIFFILDALDITATKQVTENISSTFLGITLPQYAANWVALAIAGMIGGITFDLKWLYHSVAINVWHCDRILWRLIVPFNSAMVSLFSGFLIASDIIPFLENESFDNIYTLLGCGFLFGYFSDNILAALQNFALRIFGTLSAKE